MKKLIALFVVLSLFSGAAYAASINPTIVYFYNEKKECLSQYFTNFETRGTEALLFLSNIYMGSNSLCFEDDCRNEWEPEEHEIAFSLAGIGKGATAPTETRLGNTFGYAFSIGDDGYANFEVPKEWDGISNFTLHLHTYTPEAFAANSGEIRFEAAWSSAWEFDDEPVDATNHSGIILGSDMNISKTSKGMKEYNLGSIPAVNITFDDVIYIKIKRIALINGNNPVQEPVVTQMEYEFNGD